MEWCEPLFRFISNSIQKKAEIFKRWMRIGDADSFRHCLSLLVTVYQCLSLLITAYHCLSLLITACQCVSLRVTAAWVSITTAFNWFPIMFLQASIVTFPNHNFTYEQLISRLLFGCWFVWNWHSYPSDINKDPSFAVKSPFFAACVVTGFMVVH